MTLLSQAIEIRDANIAGENTAVRVGNWMVDAVGEIDAAALAAAEAIVLATVATRDTITGNYYTKTGSTFFVPVADNGTEGKSSADSLRQLLFNVNGLTATAQTGDSANITIGVADSVAGEVRKISGANLLAPAMNAAAAAQGDADQALLDAAAAQTDATEALAEIAGLETQLTGYATLAGAQTITGQKTFSSPLVLGTSGAPISGSVTTGLFLDGDGKTAQRTLGSLAFASSTAFISNQFASVQAADFAVNSGFFGSSLTEGWQIDSSGFLYKTAGASDAAIGIENNNLAFVFDGTSGILYEAPTGAGTETLAIFQQPTTNKLVSRTLGTGAFATISDYLTTATAASTYATIAGFKAFAAYRSTNQTIASGGGYVAIVFDNETYDTGSNYNPATGVITIPSGELWRIDVTVDTDHTDVLLLRLYDVTGATSVQQARLAVVGATTSGTASFNTRAVGVSTEFRIEIARAGGSYDLLGGTAPALVYISAQRVNR